VSGRKGKGAGNGRKGKARVGREALPQTKICHYTPVILDQRNTTLTDPVVSSYVAYSSSPRDGDANPIIPRLDLRLSMVRKILNTDGS